MENLSEESSAVLDATRARLTNQHRNAAAVCLFTTAVSSGVLAAVL